MNSWELAIKEISDWMKLDKTIVVPFVGAGVSRAANLPNWQSLATNILDITYGFGLATEENVRCIRNGTALESLTFSRNKLGEEMFRKQVVNALKIPKDISAPEVACLCWRLNENLVVTTNLDEVLELAAVDVDNNPAVAITPTDNLSALTEPGKRILHLHGTLSRYETWVMTNQGYDSITNENSPIGTALQTLLLDRVLLFVGYSCADPDLQYFLDKFVSYFPRGSSQHYALVPEMDTSQ